MWYKYIFIFFLFYIFAVLQNGFLVHFNLFGVVPNLVFILFFLLVFFSAQKGPAWGWEIAFYAITAGFFLDIFSYTYFGASIVILVIVGFASKKIQSTLQEVSSNKFPLAYFLGLFLPSLIIYNVLFEIFLDKFNFAKIIAGVNLSLIAGVIYNLFIACIGFWIYKKLWPKFTK